MDELKQSMEYLLWARGYYWILRLNFFILAGKKYFFAVVYYIIIIVAKMLNFFVCF